MPGANSLYIEAFSGEIKISQGWDIKRNFHLGLHLSQVW